MVKPFSIVSAYEWNSSERGWKSAEQWQERLQKLFGAMGMFFKAKQ